MVEEVNKAIFRRYVEEVTNRGNLELADEIFGRYHAHQPGGLVLERGPEDVKRFNGEFRSAFHNCENLNGGVPGWSDPNPQGPRHVPSERFVGQTGDVVTAPLRAGRDFIGECAFDQEGLVAVVSALLRLSSEREQLLIDL
jgi:hypothetical protein